VAKTIVLLSGPVCAGKSTLARSLAERYASYGVVHVRTHVILREADPSTENSREALQALGEKLDKRTKGEWVREALDKIIYNGRKDDVIVVDAVRIPDQIEAVRRAYGRRVVHVHLTAPLAELEQRYAGRSSLDLKEFGSYAKVRQDRTEARVEELARLADVVVDSKQCTKDDVVVRAASHIGLFGKECLRLVDVMVGGQYGSEGKGQVAAYLANEYDVLVRVGGPNAGHTVFRVPDPYTFHHLPSGTFDSGARLILGPGAVLRIDKLLSEIAECGVDFERLSIDPQAMTISDDDRRIESDGVVKAISSTGQGVGEATARKIRERGKKSVVLAAAVPELRPFVRPTCDFLEEAFAAGKKILLEGTQGTGLSLHHGSYPHVTSRDTTVAGCLAEAGISPSRVRKVILVCRTYPIRVEGKHSGPMAQEIDWAEVSRRSGIELAELEKTEKTSTTKRRRRVCEFDWVLLRKSASLNAPTDIALTFADYLSVKNRDARRFEQLTQESIRFIEEVERVAQAPVSLISTRFHSRSIIDRRAW
jgi:adenylosuccinate synthase